MERNLLRFLQDFMPKICTTKQAIEEAAQELATKGFIPTQKLIRQKLGKGSGGTIQKYLRAWKEKCFKQEKLISASDEQPDILATQEWAEEKRTLEQSLSQQLAKNEQYAQELTQAEKQNVILKEAFQQLQASHKNLELELKEVTVIKATLERINQEIQLRLELGENKALIKQQAVIEELQVELKQLNAKSMAALQELSSQGHEALMQEKVHAINLKAKIDSLTQELNKSHNQLELERHKGQTQLLALQRQIRLQQKILQTHLSQEKLQQLEQSGVELLLDLEGS